MQMLDGRGSAGGDNNYDSGGYSAPAPRRAPSPQPQSQPQQNQAPQQSAPPAGGFDDFDDDIPF